MIEILILLKSLKGKLEHLQNTSNNMQLTAKINLVLLELELIEIQLERYRDE